MRPPKGISRNWLLCAAILLHLFRSVRVSVSEGEADPEYDASKHWLSITSLNLPLVNMMWNEKRKGFVLNHPIPIPLHAYFDAFDGEGTLPTLPNVRYINLTIAQPWAHMYIAANLTRGSVTQQAYKRIGHNLTISPFTFNECWGSGTADEPMRKWPLGPQKKCSARDPHCKRTDGWCTDPILILKVASFYDAVTTTNATRILWLDSDAYFQRPPDRRFFEWMALYDVVTIFRYWPRWCKLDKERPWMNGCNPETGVVAFSVTSESKQLVEDMRNAYYLYDTPAYRGIQGLNDINVVKYLLNNGVSPGYGKLRPKLRVGRFATGCRPLPGVGETKVKWLYDARWYANKDMDCPRSQNHTANGVSVNVSPFNVFEYVTHCKGSGPRRQSPAKANSGLLDHC